jgi:hypothetical protein
MAQSQRDIEIKIHIMYTRLPLVTRSNNMDVVVFLGVVDFMLGVDFVDVAWDVVVFLGVVDFMLGVMV